MQNYLHAYSPVWSEPVSSDQGEATSSESRYASADSSVSNWQPDWWFKHTHRQTHTHTHMHELMTGETEFNQRQQGYRASCLLCVCLCKRRQFCWLPVKKYFHLYVCVCVRACVLQPSIRTCSRYPGGCHIAGILTNRSSVGGSEMNLCHRTLTDARMYTFYTNNAKAQ